MGKIAAFALATESVVPVRKTPDDASEMVTQLLFGERAYVYKREGAWVSVESCHDRYAGWADAKMLTRVAPSYFGAERELCYVRDVAAPASRETKNAPPTTIWLPLGAEIPAQDAQNHARSFAIGDATYRIAAGHVAPELPAKSHAVAETALRYLNAPYLWGGKSPFGVDCSGLTQMVYRMHGAQLPRDAWQQAETGEAVPLAEQRPGDLAFFVNDKGRVHHVGVIVEEGKILHASGRVKIDALFAEGVFSHELNKLTHRLHSIKRVLA